MKNLKIFERRMICINEEASLPVGRDASRQIIVSGGLGHIPNPKNASYVC
jgi:hypothetical protein